MPRSPRTLLLICSTVAACGDDTASSAPTEASASSVTTTPTSVSATQDPTGDPPTTSVTATGTGNSGSGTDSAGTTEVAPTTTAVTATTGTPGTTSTTATTSTTSETSTTSTTSETTTDNTTGTTGTTTGGDCPGNGGDVEFSYIWIANSPDGTVSKLDTQTLKEVGRYRVRPQGGGEPSRTSVNLRGDVVIGSRLGGVTKIWARPEDCKDTNGTPGIQTSKGKDDVLAWGQEECVAWYTDYNFISERAVAWTTGTLNPQTCEYEDPQVWIGATTDAMTLRVFRLHGDDGSMDGMVNIPGTVGYMTRSPYGAAVDANNEVWMVNAYCGGTLIQVHEDYMVETFATPAEVCPYGIAVDSKGYVWIGGYQGSTGRYDPMTKKWDLVAAQGLGIQEDAKGKLWLGAYGKNGVYEIDGDSLAVLSYTALPTTGQSKGVSIDFFGYVWIVSDAGTTAVRMDPVTKAFQTYTGLSEPYSYSDMTGWGLKNAVIPQ